jgi:Secretion system C-terminal sorting domain
MKNKYFLFLLVALFNLNANAQWIRIYSLYYQANGTLIDSAGYFYNDLVNDSIIDYAPIAANQFDNSYRQVFEYDGNGNIVMQTNSIYNTGWILSNRILKAYNSSQQLVETIYQMYDNNVWENNIKVEYTYDSNGLLVMEVMTVWNGTGWDFTWQQLYTNNNAGHVTSIEYIYVDAMWQESASHTFTYTDGLLTQNLKVDDVGEPLNKMEYTYDTDGRVTYSRNSEWNASANDWVYSDRYYTYDENGNLINEVTGYQVYTGKAIEYFAGSNIVHVYSLFVNIEQPTLPSLISIVPNPANDFFTIDIVSKQSTLVITNHAGQVAETVQLQKGKHQIDVSAYSAGVYYVALHDNQFSQCAKLIVK